MDIGLISLLSIVLGLVLLIFLSFRGISILILGPIVSAIVLFFSRTSVLEGMKGAYASSFAGFIENNFLVFLGASILGAMLGESGAARDIAVGIVRVTSKGGKNAKFYTLMGLSIITAVLTLGGVSGFVVVFTVAPICKELFKEMDIPWHLVMAILVYGGSMFTQTMPGSPAIMNLIPIEYLGTSAMAAPWLGLVTTLIAIVAGAIYIKYELVRSEKNGEGFMKTGFAVDKFMPSDSKNSILNGKHGSILKALTPSITLLVTLNILNMDTIYALFLAIIVCAILYYNKFDNLSETFGQGGKTATMSIMNVSAIVGFAGVIEVVPGFDFLIEGLESIPGPPLIQLVLATNIMAAITGSASAAEGISLESFAGRFIQQGYDPNVIHRIINLSGTGMDAMPHNGSMINRLEYTKLTHKQGYYHEFIMGGVIPFLISLFSVVLVEIGIV